jgi:ribose-phosphate pyrophosphokinase
MLVLNLDPLFSPTDYIEIAHQQMRFAGGEPHIKISPDFDKTQAVTITHRIQRFEDVGMICLAVDALHRMDAVIDNLIIPYFPAARQDRVMITGEPLSVKVYADIINALGFKKVIVFDAHSEVTAAVLNHCEVIPNQNFIKQVLNEIKEEVLLISPDGGALKKIYKVSEFLGGKEVIECSKSRDVKTGKLTGAKVYADDLGGKACLIVDDICDGGGTFIGLAEALKLKGAGKLYLAVSHGIFSKGFEELKCFERVFTTNSFMDVEDGFVTQIKLKIK